MSATVATVTPMRPGKASRSPEWMSPEQVAECVPGLTKERLQYLRDNGRGPAYYKPTDRTVVYDRADVDAWIQARRVVTRDAS